MIVELDLRNWGPFRGRHVIKLGPGPIAVVATHVDNSGRSNGTGKSMLLEGIDFAITGELKKLRGFDADGWITRGEKEGWFKITLDNGAWIKRSKKRGQPLQIRAGLPGRDEASQAGAHEAFLKFLAFSKDDYRKASYFEQKKAARLLELDPGPRLAMVTSWLGLELGDRAEARAAEIASQRWREVERLQTKQAGLASLTRPELPNVDDMLNKAKKIRADLAVQAELADRLAESSSKQQARVYAAGTVEAHEKDIARGKELRAWVDENKAHIEERERVTDARATEATNVTAAAETELRSKKKVTLGQFDGRCPVAEIECPAHSIINKDRTAAKSAYDKALVARDEAKRIADVANDEHGAAHGELRTLEIKEAELERLRDKVRTHAPTYKAAKDLLAKPIPDAGGDVRAVRARCEELRQELTRVEAEILTNERMAKQAVESAEQLRKVTAELEVARAQHRAAHRTRVVFRTTRRRVAERALGDVEHDANDAIAGAGVDLGFKVRWEREGKKLALECDECGSPFPPGERVKQCETCGSPRGLHTTPRLDFVLTDSSGGYDDLVGIALQLSAGAWLLEQRRSPWSTCVLDEPTAALDSVLRSGLVRYLSTVTRRGVYRQMLLVSHSADFVDALPGRILITRQRDGERQIQVVS